MSRDEALEHAGAIVEASDLPVSADLENCFGDEPETVAETIRQAAAVGLVGGSVEDATGNPRRPIYDRVQAVERVAAAVAAARALPFPFVVVARAETSCTTARTSTTPSGVCKPMWTWRDALFAPGLPDLDAVRRFVRRSSRPVNALAGGTGGVLTVANLSAAGVRRISVGSALTRAVFGAFLRAAREIAETGTFTFGDDAASFAELTAFMAGR